MAASKNGIIFSCGYVITASGMLLGASCSAKGSFGGVLRLRDSVVSVVFSIIKHSLIRRCSLKSVFFPPSRSREKISSVRKNILSQTTGVNSNEHIRARSPYLPRLRSRGGPTRARPLQAARPHLRVPGLPAPPPRAPPRLPLTHFFNYYVNTAPILKGTLQLTFQKSYKALPREGRERKETAHVTFES